MRRSGTGGWPLAPAFALALLAAGCDDQKSGADNTVLDAARTAAEAELRRLGGEQTTLRGVQLYRQAQGGTAVCGQVNLPELGAAFTLFVSVVTPGDGDKPGVEQFVATSGPSASRVFVETVLRCYEEGGPPPQHRAGAPPPMPPVPDRLPEESRTPPPGMVQPRVAPPQAAMPPPSASGDAPAALPGRTVIMRQNGNLRSHPNGGGAVIRVVPAGTPLQVFLEAPGGWLQVGAGAPEGWMHGSMAR
ncbi:SH3 domain-containing protein [Teichococcus vastitatis]|uniref:SH3 domain-containing protein n=1 Tax=Teichococcus vastitatis TaxID=2307076 RepID=A0ABS9W7J4_9PROT|nr:SH3 domain-containing protein [Pseudoroseomonas vastitatis]MCI0755269.1 SH3 domain-containing protein [Pseudoroseomonas vastitatis]